ncbi:MAG: hypothetical protein ACRCZC_06275, partial [Culicoidibacterales bacterium]
VDDTINALSVDGVEASSEKVQSGEYLIARPFILAYQEAELTDAAKTFLEWTLTEEAQEIIAEKFISVN